MDTLHILWTSENKEAFLEMIGLYAYNSMKNDWWKKVNLIIWGPSVKLAANDNQILTELLELKNIGVSLEACRNCMDNYGVTEKLEKIVVHIDYMGKYFTKG